ncbi:hypothetical protein FSARC_5820 [Fusarium sarcochroum]|uniref:Rhodopsin domain-containing protein n=1 Tax=Fusarium sarcochroum TaxID=1208366 RepID=A0A8H4TYQ8_9HYPO|nr:hypothetical protein FSARC_5820 [Fusarium sarcochroum]
MGRDVSFPMFNGTEVYQLPPESYVVNFENPKQQYKIQHYLVFGAGASIALVALLQRYYMKVFLCRTLQIDDAFMFLGWLCSVATQILMTVSISQGGMCTHSWEMSLEHYELYSRVSTDDGHSKFFLLANITAIQISYAAAPIYTLCGGFVKLSLLTFYLNLDPLQLSTPKWFRIATWTSIAMVVSYTISIALKMLFVCNPPSKAFNFKIEGECSDAAVLHMAAAISNILTDLLPLILPIPLVCSMRLTRTIVPSVVRLVYLPVALGSTDPSWDAAPANLWTHFLSRVTGPPGASHLDPLSYKTRSKKSIQSEDGNSRNQSLHLAYRSITKTGPHLRDSDDVSLAEEKYDIEVKRLPADEGEMTVPRTSTV